MFGFLKKRVSQSSVVESVKLPDPIVETSLIELLTFKNEDEKVLTLLKTLNESTHNTQSSQNAQNSQKAQKSDALNILVKLILEKMGYRVEITDGMKDGGIDVVGYKGSVLEIGVQCKAWNPKGCNSRITSKDVQAFRGSLSSKYVQKGLFVTTHYFDDFALEAADENLILIDRRYLLEILTNYFPSTVSNYLYYQDLSEQGSCSKCENGKMIKVFRSGKAPFDWCESCRSVPSSYSAR
ncbi:restriction endonuclease [Ignatzschineria sp. LJL83]